MNSKYSVADKDVLITGAGGFVGANLCRGLLARDARVHVLLKQDTARWRIGDIRDRLHVHMADLRDAEAVARVVSDVRPRIVYHFATHGAYPFQTDGESILLVNVFGLWNLLQACKETGLDLFVNVGSSSEYGRKPHAMRESDLLEPDSYYAVAKSAQTLLARLCARLDSLPAVTLRLFSAYGPYEEPTRLIPRLLLAALRDAPIQMAAPETARDFVYVDDIVQVCLAVDALRQYPGETFNVGTGVQRTLAEVVAATEAASGKAVRTAWGGMDSRPWDSDVWVADVSKLRRLIGMRPETTLHEGIARSLDWFREHAGLYPPGEEESC